MRKLKVMDGNEACANGAYLFSEVCGIYPITPSSPMATLSDKWSFEGKTNLFGQKVLVEEMQSEGGASALVHGSLQGGRLTTTFTASQGLLLMIPSMYKIAGELLPGVIHVAARSLSTHALSIFGDHQDVYATRQTGFAMMASSNVQDAYNLAIVSHLSAIKGSIPFLHFFDGFRTSHEINKINILDNEDLLPLIDKAALASFRKRALNIEKNITRGTSETEDVYFQNTEARNKYYEKLPDIVNEYMKKINALQGTNYKPFEYYGVKDATNIIVAMGSVTDTIKLTIDELKKQNEKVGLIVVHLYRPLSQKYFLNVLPNTVRKITVLDRTKEAGSFAEPLYLDVCALLKDKSIEVIGGRYGLSSKDTTPAMIKSVYDNMKKYDPKDHFTLGIIDDVTHTNLEIDEDFQINKSFKEIKVFGFGSDGMVSASKNILKVMGDKEDSFVEGYFEYDSKKSGGVTISHLRLSDKPINAPYYVTNPVLVVISKDSYLSKYDVLTDVKEGAIVLINTDKNGEELNSIIKTSTKRIIKDKKLKVLIIDANKIADTYNLKGKINNIIAFDILKMLGASSDDLDSFKEYIKKTYKKKGTSVVSANLKALEESNASVRELEIDKLTIEEESNKNNNIYDEMIIRRGNMLKVSDFKSHEDGTFEGGTSISDKRKISSLTPSWCKENCLECNACAFICPHAVIKPISIDEDKLKDSPLNSEETIASVGEVGKRFYLDINTDMCTGCSLCEKVCPGKNGQKALCMSNNVQDEKVSEYFEDYENNTNFNKFTVKGIGFENHYFEFPGACAGCGETVYLKTLTSLYGKEIVIANATGCSSIYSASLPCTPYKVPWISSLFEDNAEFGLGLHISYKNAREKIKQIMKETKNNVSKNVKDIYKEWIDNEKDSKITLDIKEKLSNENIPEELKELIDYIPSRTVWIVGGDGWAYDIGFGGLDHVLRTGENVKVLVLDTEVYSNTGGQKSKSTRTGAIAEFATGGKLKPKKDLFQIAMNIPNCYVACISAGANNMQTIKAFKEAEEHNGPSLIIAYSPCIAHGIDGGLSNSVNEQKLLVESGYNILMRYNPDTKELTIDSKEPNFDLYETVFAKELRYKNLESINPKEYEVLYKEQVNNAKERYNYYKSLESKE